MPSSNKVYPAEFEAIERVPLDASFTPTEEVIALMCAHGHNYRDIAERLQVAENTVKKHARNAASKIPGDMPAQMKLVCWMRGAPMWILDGSWLRSPHGEYRPGLR